MIKHLKDFIKKVVQFLYRLFLEKAIDQSFVSQYVVKKQRLIETIDPDNIDTLTISKIILLPDFLVRILRSIATRQGIFRVIEKRTVDGELTRSYSLVRRTNHG
jgi:hypothetical protein